VSRTLLVNFWYAPPVGHAIEALRICLGYHAADPSLRISLLLNGATPTELAACCPFVAQTYAVPHTDFLGRSGDAQEALADVPREWDYVADNWRFAEPAQQQFAGLRAFAAASQEHFRARIAHGAAGAEPPPYRPHCRLELQLPAAVEVSGAVRIAVMPAGSSEPSRYPSARSWELILSELERAFPDATFCFFGKLRDDERTSTSFSEFDRLRGSVKRGVDVVDRPLLEQLAYVDACHVFVSPHTGFGTAALAVGTPWLALAGGPWHEWFFNGVPFHSVLPDTRRFPCYTWMDEQPRLVHDDGPRTPSMTRARIEDDLPELVEAARMLVERRLPYERALERHFPRLLNAYGGDRSKIFSLDSIHERYI
jgi:hypothetical protein